MKRFLSLLTAVLLAVTALPSAVLAAEPAAASFTDVSPEDWFHDSVTTVSKAGLMIGKGDGVFDPEGHITYAEALTIAARVHAILTTGSPDAADRYYEDHKNEEVYPEPNRPWYRTYSQYAERNIRGFASLETTDLSVRRNFARLLAAAVGDGAAEINEVVPGAIPDLEENALTAGIYRLYRAGILTGNDARGTFLPDTPIRRCEAAAIAARILDPALRRRFTLTEAHPFDTTLTAPGGWYTLTVPAWWEGEVLPWSGTNNRDVSRMDFYCRTEVERNEYGGWLGGIGVMPHREIHGWQWAVMEIATVTYPDGQTYDVTLHMPSDVQFTVGDSADYDRASRSLRTVASAMQFPEGCEVILHADAARELLQNALIEAYENTYGPFTPLETKPDGVVADSEYLRWVIPHLEVSEETDEYYEFPVIFPFRVDKRTGEIFKHYNGLDPFTVPFDPHAPNALAFAG
ncbi:MAG: S-layer homology domain-containing protein [Clostridia bacterium]|nr:S-layer homology domain-containing protein [Clostridia bacterium]